MERTVALGPIQGDPSQDNAPVIGAKGTYVSQQQGLVPSFVQAEYEDRYDRMSGQPQIDFIDTYSAAYRREVFCQNGGFDSVFTTASVEDQEFSFRLAQKGYKMVFEPSAQVNHIHDVNIADYLASQILHRLLESSAHPLAPRAVGAG